MTTIKKKNIPSQPSIPYGKQWITAEDIREVVRVLRSDFITQGPSIGEFEKDLARRCGAKYAVVFNSGTAALHGAYVAAGLRQGEEIITTPMTFAATANAALYCGARTVFADIEPDTGNIDTAAIAPLINVSTKLLAPVHYAGHPVDMKPVRALAGKHGLCVVEDACHALGASYDGTITGSCAYSDMTVFSFHPVKHITTGEGGAVTTNRASLYEKLLTFRSHGITKNKMIRRNEGPWYYEMQFLGFNYRMTDMQAALGSSQLGKLDRFVARRREIAAVYRTAFEGNPWFDLPPERAYAGHAWHLYPIRLKRAYADRRKKIFCALREKGLGVQVHYIPVYRHPYYESLGYREGLCPRAEEFYRCEISLPMYPAMTDRDIARVISTVGKVFSFFS